MLDRVPLGTRVVVRRLVEGGHRAGDALGDLVARDVDAVTVLTRTGPVVVRRADLVAARVVPPADARPWRVAAFLRRAPVAVLDLDGVLRVHGQDPSRDRAEQALGLGPGGLHRVAFSVPEATAVLTGRARYADWATAVQARLLELGHPTETVRAAVQAWTGDLGRPVAATVDLVAELRDGGTPVFVLTNGTDRVPWELRRIGLGDLVPVLINSADLGAAKPSAQAYAGAHQRIEAGLGRRVGLGQVHFTDDLPEHVDGARSFGWQARLFTAAPPAPPTPPAP